MGHIRLGKLPQSRKWRDVVDLIETGASTEVIAQAAAKASQADLARANTDPRFQFVSSLLVRLPLLARAPGFEAAISKLGLSANALVSVPNLLSEIDQAIDSRSFDLGQSTDAGELAKSALLESLSVQLRDRLPTLFEPTPEESLSRTFLGMGTA